MDIIRLTDESGNRWYAREADRDTASRWAASVTGILSVVMAPRLKQWHTKTAPEEQSKRKTMTADFGSAMHGLIECDLKGETFEIGNEDLRECFDRWLKLKAEHDIHAELVEQMVISDCYGFGGTFDIVGMCDGVKSLMDIKTGFVGVSAGWQMSAYRRAWFEQTREVLPTVTISVPRNGRAPKVFVSEHYDWQWHCFVSAFQCWKALNYRSLEEIEWYYLHKGFFENVARDSRRLDELETLRADNERLHEKISELDDALAEEVERE